MRKAICTRSRLRNKFCKNPSEKNERNIKDNEIYVYLLGVRQLNNTFLILPATEEWQIKSLGKRSDLLLRIKVV